MKARDHAREMQLLREKHRHELARVERNLLAMTADRDHWQSEALSAQQDYRQAVEELNILRGQA